MAAICIEPSGRVRTLVPRDGEFLSLREIRRAVDGTLRVIILDEENLAILNGLHHIDGFMRPNPTAEFMLSHVAEKINGPAVFMTKNEFCGRLPKKNVAINEISPVAL